MNVRTYLSSKSSVSLATVTSTVQFDFGGGFHPKYAPICEINLLRSISEILSSPALDPGENPNWVTQFLNIGQSNADVIPPVPISPRSEIVLSKRYDRVSNTLDSDTVSIFLSHSNEFTPVR